MRSFIRIFKVVILSLFISSCAAGLLPLPEKYSLDGQLEPVTKIYKYGLIEWEKVDQQSLILRTGPSDYYLLVLMIPAYELPFTDIIRLSSTGTMIRAGMDEVILSAPGDINVRYIIERIYRIKGNKQMLEIKKQLMTKDDKKDVTVRQKDKGI